MTCTERTPTEPHTLPGPLLHSLPRLLATGPLPSPHTAPLHTPSTRWLTPVCGMCPDMSRCTPVAPALHHTHLATTMHAPSARPVGESTMLRGTLAGGVPSPRIAATVAIGLPALNQTGASTPVAEHPRAEGARAGRGAGLGESQEESAGA